MVGAREHGVDDLIIIGNVSDDPFAIDVGHACGQVEEMSDLIAIKEYANSEFCPRFLAMGDLGAVDRERVGRSLAGKTVVICSTGTSQTRGALAMRTLILARAAKDNGATTVLLVEPDLFFSAQDRGPCLGPDDQGRSLEDLRKFDGQAFTADLYAELLKCAGVDGVITVHNHSAKVQKLFGRRFAAGFHNLNPCELYADYIRRTDLVAAGGDGANLVLCSPDAGAVPFVDSVHAALGLAKTSRIIMQKARDGERRVRISVRPDSDLTLEGIAGKHVIVLDDMVRTGSTIVECCRVLREGNPGRVCFGVSHFYASPEVRENLNSPFIDEILTLNTIPAILNRDTQGRLRRKLTVLKIERWIARFLLGQIGGAPSDAGELYAVDMSSKNPRWRPSPRT